MVAELWDALFIAGGQSVAETLLLSLISNTTLLHGLTV